jgi:hypothetical protein
LKDLEGRLGNESTNDNFTLRGLLMNNRADSTNGSALSVQDKGGGSIPASALFFRIGETEEVCRLIKKYHYSHRMSGSVSFVGSLRIAGGLDGKTGETVAGIVFSTPPTRWSESVLELNRLVRATNKVPLTLLISLSVKRLRQVNYDLLVSFADKTQGHIGTVYQAANWNYGGCRERQNDGLIIDGTFYPGRTCNTIYGTRSAAKLKSLKPQFDVKPHFDEGKHLYWLALSKSGEEKAKRLELKKLCYPKNVA